MVGASRRNVTRIPSPVPSAPASRGPTARRRRSVLHFFSLVTPSHPFPLHLSTRARAHSLARSLALSRRQSRCLPCLVLSPSLTITSFGMCPRNPRLFPSPFLFLSPFAPLCTALRRVFGTLFLFRSSSLSATPGVSRRLDAALPISDDGRSQTHAGRGEGDEGDSGFLVRNCYRPPSVRTNLRPCSCISAIRIRERARHDIGDRIKLSRLYARKRQGEGRGRQRQQQ